MVGPWKTWDEFEHYIGIVKRAGQSPANSLTQVSQQSGVFEASEGGWTAWGQAHPIGEELLSLVYSVQDCPPLIG